MFRVDPALARSFAATLLERTGLSADRAAAVAWALVESDLLGHRTHGLVLLPSYMQRLETGVMAKTGEIEVIRSGASHLAWRAHKLPGAWVMRQATEAMLASAEPVVTATIANCAHIGALQIYLGAFTERGRLVLLSATDPSIASVAPFGGLDPVITSNPLAMGIPTAADPILIDQCTSVISNSAVRPYVAAGKPLPGKWLLDEEGRPTDDPTVISPGRTGSIPPLGGTDFGYKGFGFGLMVEALTLALAGYGRAQRPKDFGQSVFIQSIDPAFFGGAEPFLEETTLLAEDCRKSRPVPGGEPVRLPGDSAQRKRKEQLASGVLVDPAAVSAIAPWAERFGLTIPDELAAPQT